MIKKINKIKNHKGFIKYFKNTSWLFGEKILRITLGVFIGVWVARYLGPERFGVYAYAGSFVALFTAIASFGLDGIVVREIVKNENLENKLLATSFWLKLMGAFAVLLILSIVVNFTKNDNSTNTLIFIIASASFFQSFNVIDFYFRSKVLSRYVVYANFITLFISSILKIVLITINAPLIAFAWVVLFDSFILAFGFIYFFVKKKPSFKIKEIKFSRVIAVSLLKDSWPLILSGIVVSIYMKIDQVMIKEMLNSESVGQYAAAVRLSEGWYFIPVVLTSSLFPAIINAKTNNKELYLVRLQRLYDLMVWMAIGVAIPMTFLSDWIVYLLYGPKFNEAGSVLMLHIWAGIFVALGVARSKWILAENLQNYTPIYLGFGLVINLLLNYYLINLYGINGAAWSTLISQCSATLIAPIFFKKTRISFFMMINSMFLIPSLIRILKK